MSTMARLTYGALAQAWKGEASDFTPLLAEQLDLIGVELGLDLLSVGTAEVQTTGGRRIDIVAEGEDGTEFVIENQYGRGDHDHLTRGLAYAVARRARGLIVIAEQHRDEFRAVAQYLNELAELDSDRGIAVWLVEAKAVRIGESPWAPLFTAVVEPNDFTAEVEQAKKQQRPATLEEFLTRVPDERVRLAIATIRSRWLDEGHSVRLAKDHIVLGAKGPAVSGSRAVIAMYTDGRVRVPFSSYAGGNAGIDIPALVGDQSTFRARVSEQLALDGSQQVAYTAPGWLRPERTELLLEVCREVADAYAEQLASEVLDTEHPSSS